MRKKWLFLILLVIFFFGAIGLVVWKFSQKDNSVNQPASPTQNPPSKLSEKELEKYLLEKRLDLQKYFVFNLGELKTKKEEKVLHPDYGILDNAYVVHPKLSNHLTQIGRQFIQTKKPKMVRKPMDYKNQIYFTNEIAGGLAPVEWVGEAGDENIKNPPLFYIIFDKNGEDLYLGDYFENNEYKGKVYSNAINLKTNSFRVCKNKSEALELIKTDPALAGKV
ncbi:MAG: hypothetical protein I3273_06155 [Candidatus Moeniiplasma glomeromycotorum]|nr:hypothetical protein [Candidatus Moeniiplasma glomeromycotorum]MCE8168124.1 hypothetical protein [Candidatus Moeniiplasma glomeromycotorum]MCE8169668.1 hypothetical protein [Candidatus Moeniiplasma glomeromycotorum]